MSRNDRFDAQEEPQGLAAIRVGQDLRLTREHYGWTLEAVSEHLRIRLAYLEAIEDGRPADLPGNAYAIGFVRTYAKALGLDQDEIARRFRAEAGEINRRTELTFPAPVPERGVPALAVVAVGAILVIGAYAAWYRMSGEGHLAPEAVQVVPERLEPLVSERPTAPAPGPAASGAKQEAVTPPESVPAPAEPSPEPAPAMQAFETGRVSPSQAAAASPPPVAVPAPVPANARIVVRAKSDAWIQVKDSHGQVLLNRVLRGGETWSVPDRPAAGGQSALLLTTGNAGGTELLVDGVTSASLGGDGSVRRDLPLDAEAIRDGKLAANVAPPAFHSSPRNQ